MELAAAAAVAVAGVVGDDGRAAATAPWRSRTLHGRQYRIIYNSLVFSAFGVD